MLYQGKEIEILSKNRKPTQIKFLDMNQQKCIKCNNWIDLDFTDWCDTCNISIFDGSTYAPKTLTILNIKSNTTGLIVGGWVFDNVREDYRYSGDAGRKGRNMDRVWYSMELTDTNASNKGKFLLRREVDEFTLGKYLYEIWLNGERVIWGAKNLGEIKDKAGLLQFVVTTLDTKLYKINKSNNLQKIV